MKLVLVAALCVSCSGQGGGINYDLPTCSGSYDPAQYSYCAEYNGQEQVFFLGICPKGGTADHKVICQCPTLPDGGTPEFTGQCPR